MALLGYVHVQRLKEAKRQTNWKKMGLSSRVPIINQTSYSTVKC